MANNETFIKITNLDIWNKLNCIEKKLDGNKTQIKVLWTTLALYGVALGYLFYVIGASL